MRAKITIANLGPIGLQAAAAAADSLAQLERANPAVRYVHDGRVIDVGVVGADADDARALMQRAIVCACASASAVLAAAHAPAARVRVAAAHAAAEVDAERADARTLRQLAQFIVACA